MTIHERVKYFRKEKRYSQEQLARKLHVSQSAVSQWEKGITKPPADQLPALADIFGISVDELIGRDTQPVKKQTAVVDQSLIDALMSLTPSQLQRVRDFVAGMLSSQAG